MKRTGLAKLKALGKRGRWIAIITTVAAHVALFAFMPPFQIPTRSRMVVTLSTWGPPAVLPDAPPGLLVIDTLTPGPRLVNQADVNHRVPRVYPWVMWHFREPSSAQVQVTVGRSGRVRDVALVDGDAGAGQHALLALARLMRFDLTDSPAAGRGLVGTVEIGVVSTGE